MNTNDSNYKLFVETGMRTKKIKVDQDGWPDYVFDSTVYKLNPLSNVETYIKQNGHLPDTPSAADVKKKVSM